MKLNYTLLSKKLALFSLFGVMSISTLFAQAPESFKYQSAVRDASGNVIANQNVSFEISILTASATGTAVYTETHTVTTTAQGIANLNIGEGTATLGTLSAVDWANGPYFIQVALDENGGSSFTVLGASQLLSVPYALHAKTVENDLVDDADADATNEIQDISLTGTDLSISNGSTVSLAALQDGFEANTDEQALTLTGATLSISGGNSVDLSPLAGGGATDDQMLSISGNTLSIENGNSIDLSSLQDGTGSDDQMLSVTGNTLSIEGGNSIDLSSLQDGFEANTDAQALTFSGATLSISGGNSVDLSSLAGGGGTDDQMLSISGNALSIENGNTIDLSSYMDDTDMQTLSLTGNALSIENGNTIDLSTLQDGTGSDDQTLSLTGTTLSIENGNTIDLSPIDTDTDDQTLTLNGSALTISEGNSVDLSTTGPGIMPITTFSSAGTVDTKTQMVRITAAVEVTLPASPVHGQMLIVIGGTGGASINPNGKNMRDGATFLGNSTRDFNNLCGGGGTVSMIFDGFNWNIYAKNAGPEYLHIHPQEFTTVSGKDVVGWTDSFDVLASNGIAHSETDDYFTLKAGKVYELEACIYLHNTNNLNDYSFRFYDITNSTLLGSGTYMRSTDDVSATITGAPVATAIVAPTTDINVVLENLYPASPGGFITPVAPRGYIKVKEIR